MPTKIDIDENKVIELYLKYNKTYKDIANIFKVSVPTIKRRIRKNNAQRGLKYPFNEYSFSMISGEAAYWAGFIAADGWISDGNNGCKKKKMRIELSSKDTEHLKKICYFMKRDPVCIRTQYRKKTFKAQEKTYCSCILEIGNTQIVYDLMRNFNISQAKSKTLLPPDLKEEDYIRAFIRGYFDGDGHVGEKCNIVFTTGSMYFAKWVKSQLYKYTDICVSFRSNDGIFRLHAGRAKGKKILEWLYTNSDDKTRLDRKFRKFKE